MLLLHMLLEMDSLHEPIDIELLTYLEKHREVYKYFEIKRKLKMIVLTLQGLV